MNEIQEYSFGKKSIRTVTGEDEGPLFRAKDVCAVLDIGDVAQAVSRLEDDEKLIRTIHVSGQGRETLLVNESGLYTLIIRSNKTEAKAFRKWITAEVLPSIRKTGGYTNGERGSVLSEVDKDEKAAEIFINLVRPAESGRILLAHKVCEKHGLPTDLLPHYAEEKHTASMTELLKKFGFPYSAQAMNKKLIAAGILSEKTRKSSHGEKKFFVITENGERFGKNLVSPQNPRETQPHWFEETFAEMIKVVA